MSASELVKSRPPRASACSGPAHYRPIAPVTPIPVVEPPPKAKRGRKPNPGSKSVREALRKESHSRIEKRRREKINETLTTLRELIAQGEGNTQQQHSPPPGPEREFKLELLERTVIFVRGLLGKTRRLEQELSELKGTCYDELAVETESEPPRKRKKIATPLSSPQEEADELDLDDSSALSESDTPPPPAVNATAAETIFPAPATIGARRNMSIAALLSPSVAPVLPSPPPSGHLRAPTNNSESQMETLYLPSPEVTIGRSPTRQSPFAAGLSRDNRLGESEADDTAAAALLLQFSSKTPMSMLGMRYSPA